MVNLSLNNAGSIFNVMSTHNSVGTAATVGANNCGAISRCMGTSMRTLRPILSAVNNVRGVGNVNVNTPGNGFCANAVRFTPGLP